MEGKRKALEWRDENVKWMAILIVVHDVSSVK